MKKLNQKGFSHHLMIIGIAVLVVAAAGFAGYRVYKGKQLDAQAAGWGLVSKNGTAFSINGCKSPNGQYRVYLLNRTSGTLTIKSSNGSATARGNSNSASISATANGGSVTGSNMNYAYWLPGPYATLPGC